MYTWLIPTGKSTHQDRPSLEAVNLEAEEAGTCFDFAQSMRQLVHLLFWDLVVVVLFWGEVEGHGGGPVCDVHNLTTPRGKKRPRTKRGACYFLSESCFATT